MLQFLSFSLFRTTACLTGVLFTICLLLTGSLSAQSIDPAFTPAEGANDRVYTMTLQADEKVLIGGVFTRYNGTIRYKMVRINTDGSLDTGFDPGEGPSGTVYSILQQPDGKILIGGVFVEYNRTARKGIARINADGSLDPGFSIGTGTNGIVHSIARQSDGKVLIGGAFTQYNGTTRNGIARLNANGSLDKEFDPGSGADNTVTSIVVQADGKILAGGKFTQYNGTARKGIVRINADGTLDAGFDPGSGADNQVTCMLVRADGKILIGGVFSSYSGIPRYNIARLHADGSLDTGFNPGSGANGELYCMVLEGDGKLLIGGVFGTYNGATRNFLARINIDGSPDTGFNTGSGPDNVVTGLAFQADGKFVMAGNFTSFSGTEINRVARLNNDVGPVISDFSATSGTVCTGNPATFTATLSNLTGSYNYTITNGTVSVSGIAGSNAFSQTLTTAGSGSQTFTLIIRAGNGSTVAIAPLTVESHPDYSPLVDLYTRTNGAGWTNKTGWLTNCDPCSWAGVSCTNGRVTYIDLRSNGLTGSLPASLGNLAGLEYLNLQNNRLSGRIPADLSRLTKLKYLALGDNQLSGCYPASLTALCGIEYRSFIENAGLPDGGSNAGFTIFCSTRQGGDAFVPVATAGSPAVCVGGTVSLSTGGGSSYSWTAPAGAVLTGSGGSPVVSASSTAAGLQTFTVVVSQGGSCSQVTTVSLTANPLPTVSITPSVTTLTCATPAVHLLATGGATYLWDDHSVNASRSVNVAATYSVTALSGNGCPATASATVTSSTAVIGVMNPLTTTATTGSAFSQTFTATGGSGPYAYSLAGGTLPTGLMLSPTGVLSGTPTQAGTFTITAQATEAGGCRGTGGDYVLAITRAFPCGAVVYVTPQGAGLQDGSTWDDAFAGTALQTAINTAATCGAQVWVARGLYKPTATTDPSKSFSMKEGVAIYGGFLGTETILGGRPEIGLTKPSGTTLSGDIDNDGTLANNSYHVISNPRGLTPDALIDGFMITGGNGPDVANLGGGIYNNGSGSGQFCNPTIRNCYFQGNASFRGGAIFNNGLGGACNPVISNCVFRNNSSDHGGGGAIWNAAIQNGISSPLITNCLFEGNTANLFGGGAIFNDAEGPGVSNPQLINCVFLNNSSPVAGGAIFSGVSGNNSSCSPRLTNCSFQGNSSPGGVIYSRGSAVSSSLTELVNCVFFNNGNGAVFVTSSATVTASYSLFGPDVTGYSSGPGNLTTATSPFAGTATAQLAGCSPALNAGLNSASGLSGIATDLAGDPRFFAGGPVDMGAYEYQTVPIALSITNPSVTTAIQYHVFSQPFTATGGSSPYAYSLAGGMLPTGLTLGVSGVLSGTPTQTGNYTITVQATDAQGCSDMSKAFVLFVDNDTPGISGFTALDNGVCVGHPVTFTAAISQVTGTYAYTLTNGSSSLTGTAGTTTISLGWSAAGAGLQSFTLTVSAGGKSGSATTGLTVNTLPEATILAPASTTLTCTTAALSLTATGGSSYRWDDHTTNAVRLITAAGIYSVTVTDSNGCTAVSNSLTVSQGMSMSPFTVNSVSVCVGQTASLVAGGCSGQVRWSTGATGSLLVLTAGSSTSLLTATCTVGSCSVTAAGSVVIGGAVPPPVQILSFVADESACPVRLVGQAAATAFVMTGPGGYVYSSVYREGSRHEAIGLNVKQPGTYTLTATSTNACGSSEPVSRPVTVTRSCP